MLSFLILPSFASGQSSIPTDSLALIGIPRWIHWRALQEIQVARACDSLRLQLQEEIDTLTRARSADSLVIRARTRQLELEQAGSQVLQEQRANAEERAELQGKQVKRMRRMDYLAAGGAVLVAALGGPAWLVAIIAVAPAGRHLVKK